MILFLTSSPTGDLDGKYTCVGLDNRNGFADMVRRFWRPDAKVLMITAFPDDWEANKQMGEFFHEAILKTGLSCSVFDLWDRQVLSCEANYSKEVLQSYDVIFLGGGHVPTQQAFFQELHLREHMEGFDGMVIGISAGTMNSADVVYAQPEEPGEATDPDYQRFIQGLGLTKINILPHYQLAKNSYKDGMHLFDEISIPDSRGRRFVTLPDGSFVVDWKGWTRMGQGQWLEEHRATVHGKSYFLEDGRMFQFSEDGEIKEL